MVGGWVAGLPKHKTKPTTWGLAELGKNTLHKLWLSRGKLELADLLKDIYCLGSQKRLDEKP